jgi:acetyl-CoA synthetase
MQILPMSSANPWTVRPGYRVYPHKLNICTEVLDRHIREGRGDAQAVLWPQGRWSFVELQRVVTAFAVKAKLCGVKRGDRIIVLGRNSPFSVAAVLAGFKIGAVPVMLNSLLAEAEIDYIIDNSDARVAFVPSSNAGALRVLLAKGRLERLFILQGNVHSAKEEDCTSLDQDGKEDFPTVDTDALEPAFMVYSSGTTGQPKGIVHAHRWVVTVGDPNVLQMTFGPHDVVTTTGEYSFMGNFGHAFIFPLYAGSAIAVYGDRVTPEAVLSFFNSVKPTIFLSVPTFYRSMLAAPGFAAQLRNFSFRFMISTGESLGAAVWNRWHQETGITICELYGVSEVQSLISNSPLLPVKPGSIGKPAPGVNVALLNESLDKVAPGETGVFAIHRSDPGLFLEYHKQPDKWKAQHRGDWYYTGDVMRVDEDGYFWYVGRGDDLFKSRGYLISPHEIENVLQRHPAVAEVAIVPEPDELAGNTIAGFILLRNRSEGSPSLEADIIEFARKHLAPYKAPKSLRFVDELPKSPVGKILRRALRAEAKS